MKLLNLALGTALGLLATTLVSAQCPPPEVAAPCPGSQPQLLHYGEQVNSCALDAAETKIFIFDGEAGDWIWIGVRSLTQGFDPQVQVVDPNGEDVLSVGCTVPWNETCSAGGWATPLGLSGSYTIYVWEAGYNQSGSFRMNLEQRTPPPGAGWCCELNFGQIVDSNLQGGTDLDFYAFQGNAGSTVKIVLQPLTEGLDPNVALLDESGVTIESAGSSCPWNQMCQTVVLETTLPDSGLYYLMLWEGGLNQGGGYSLSLQCLFPVGACDLVPFIRGDSNSDATLDLSDAIHILDSLFGQASSSCEDSQDVNDDGMVDISDAVFALSFQFGGGPNPPDPYPLCGFDPSPDSLRCLDFEVCP